MKFAHLGDCHLGGWRESKLRDLNFESFKTAIEICIKEKVDFVLIAGDLFNTPIPSIECLKFAVEQLKKLKNNGIKCYAVAGSHDFSLSGRSIIDVLDSAELLINVAKFEQKENKTKLNWFVDEKVAIIGVPGLKGELEKNFFKNLAIPNLASNKFKIFLFHSGAIEDLPEGFDYYATGHLHLRKQIKLFNKPLVFPGPTFPNNVNELEELRCGSFVIYDDGQIKEILLPSKALEVIEIDCSGLTSNEVLNQLKNIKLKNENTIVLIKIKGEIIGSVSEIKWQDVYETLYNQGAWLVLRSTNLTSKEFEIKNFPNFSSIDEIENQIINEAKSNLNLFNEEEEKAIIKSIISVLSKEKSEDQTSYNYEAKIKSDLDKLFFSNN